MTAQGAVGALSSTSPEFLVPFFANNLMQESIRVLVTAFRETHPSDFRNDFEFEYTQTGHFSLPLPIITRSSTGLCKQLYISARVSSESQLVRLVAKWVRRFAAVFRLLGDRELAAIICLHGDVLVRKLTSMSGVVRTPEEAYVLLLRSVYELTMKNKTPTVTLLRRPYHLPHLTTDDIGSSLKPIQQLVQTLAASDTRTLRFRERGFLRLRTGNRDFTIRQIMKENDNTYKLATTNGIDFKLEINSTSVYLFSRTDGKWQPQKGELLPYGILTLCRVADFGELCHVPWYAKFQSGRLRQDKSSGLRASEFVSPISPKDKLRAGSLIGGEFRLLPGGSSLLDYQHRTVTRYKSTLVGLSSQTSTWWLGTILQDSAYGGLESRERLFRRGRGVAQRLVNHFVRMLESGHGLRSITNYRDNSSLFDDLNALFMFSALMNLIRKCTHPSSHKVPPRSFLTQFMKSGWTNEVVDNRVIFDTLTSILQRLQKRRVNSFQEFFDSIDKTIQWLALWTSSEQGFVPRVRHHRIAFPDLTKDNWFYHSILVRRLEEVTVNFVLTVWALTQTVLGANLWNLYLLLGPEELSAVVTETMARRFRKKITGFIPFERN
jgi:hypothetical protein